MSNSRETLYRSPNDTEKIWKLKKQFIEKYKDKFEENYLLCLAQCYVNTETLGCRLVVVYLKL
jgi:hypothetical protein